MKLRIRRVVYGKRSTPTSKREYRLYEGGPVGTLEEWKDFCRNTPGCLGLSITEADGSIEEVEVHKFTIASRKKDDYI